MLIVLEEVFDEILDLEVLDDNRVVLIKLALETALESSCAGLRGTYFVVVRTWLDVTEVFSTIPLEGSCVELT